MHCKKTIDARSYSHEALEQLRRDSVKRVEPGASPELGGGGLGGRGDVYDSKDAPRSTAKARCQANGQAGTDDPRQDAAAVQIRIRTVDVVDHSRPDRQAV